MTKTKTNTCLEWASGDDSKTINWEHDTSGTLSYHQFYRVDQEQFSEAGEVASWGSWYLATNETENNGVSEPVSG